MTLLFGRTQDAYGTPFDPTDPDAVAVSITSDTVQKAIIEVFNRAPGQASRYNLFFGWDGNANTGRWLEQFKGIPSNNSPFVIVETSVIRTFAISCASNTTASMGLFRNGILIQTISIVSSRIGVLSGLNIPLFTGDTLSARPTAGSFSRPAFNIGIQVTP